MKFTTKKDFIWIVDEAIPDFVCDDLIKIFESEAKIQRTYNRQETENVSPLKKKDEACTITDYHTINYNLNTDAVFANVRTVLNLYLEEYAVKEHYKHLSLDKAKVQKTKPGGGYHAWHVEKSNLYTIANRVFVYTVYLNDNFKGGETEFLHQGLRCEAKKGRVCIFPAGFPYVHRGNPPLDGNKYILTSWISSPYLDVTNI